MKILILNSGSSSIKFQLLEMPEGKVISKGQIDRIGLDSSTLKYQTQAHQLTKQLEVEDHQTGLSLINDYLQHPEYGIIKNTNEVKVVGHRVVHGGASFSGTQLITKEVKKEIKRLFDLAPLHNPPNLEGVEVAEKLFKEATQVAVFDTAFHQTIPEKAYRYAIPEKLYQEQQIRVYGFHGTSHKYVSREANAYLKGEAKKMVTIHLGNGSSMTAVLNGESIDTSMGFSPSNGLIMGTRSGDIDSGLPLYLMDSLGYTAKVVSKLLQKESGFLGLTGESDMREINSKRAEGDKTAQLAYAMSAYRIQKYIGAYAAAMNGLDTIVFTAGIGENDATMRKLVCQNMDYFGIQLDEEENAKRVGGIHQVNSKESKVNILIVPTNEELEIAMAAYDMVK